METLFGKVLSDILSFITEGWWKVLTLIAFATLALLPWVETRFDDGLVALTASLP